MTSDLNQAQAAVRAAEEAIAAFDASTLVNEDGSTSETAQAKLRSLHERLDAARARLAEGGPTPP